MIIKVGPLEGPGSGGGSPPITAEYNYDLSNGETIMIPDSEAIVINVLLWHPEPITDIQIILPPLMAGRRVFVFANEQISQVTYTSTEGEVANGIVSMNMNDLVVFNTVSVANKIWARVATS